MRAAARFAAIAGVATAATSCGSGALAPAPLDTRTETCAYCRMAISEPRYAAQIVAPGEEPTFFDEIGCLANAWNAEPRPGAIAYVADHRTRAWVPAARAIFTRVDRLETPMGSHLIAHADAAARDADPDATGGTPVAAGGLFGGTVPGAAR